MPAFFLFVYGTCMKYVLKRFSDLEVMAEIAIVEPIGKVKEYQVIIHMTAGMTSFNQQLISLQKALTNLLADDVLQHAEPVFAQCFLSDAANQQEDVSKMLSEQLNCAVSYVKQPPLDGSKLALWLQLQSDVTTGNDGLAYYEHNGYRQYYTSTDCGLKTKENYNSYQQTIDLLEIYEEQLKKRECTIERDCIRTWFFVRDVDLNYQGVVDARKENFRLNGLNNETHYIASTGIEGSNSNPNVNVLMNTHTIKGLDKDQINFLYAKDYLSPTCDYGVTFERGVSIDFGDRRKVYISGTASIDNKGIIVHPGDIVKQVYRMWENVDALLKEADCSFDDVMQIFVYLRDIADYQCVKQMYDEKLPNIPTLIVLAPICRPGWLVEMECIALKHKLNKNYRDL